MKKNVIFLKNSILETLIKKKNFFVSRSKLNYVVLNVTVNF